MQGLEGRDKSIGFLACAGGGLVQSWDRGRGDPMSPWPMARHKSLQRQDLGCHWSFVRWRSDAGFWLTWPTSAAGDCDFRDLAGRRWCDITSPPLSSFPIPAFISLLSLSTYSIPAQAYELIANMAASFVSVSRRRVLAQAARSRLPSVSDCLRGLATLPALTLTYRDQRPSWPSCPPVYR